MRAERGIKQHGHANELESVGRKWKECTDRVKARHCRGEMVGNSAGRWFDHLSMSCIKAYARPTRCRLSNDLTALGMALTTACM